MTYISREAAFKEFAEFVRDSDFLDAPTWNDAVSLIGSLPAADVVEVVHGSPVKVFEDPWTGKMFTTCSRCDGKISPKDKWCKHCGAKIDGRSKP